MIYRAASGTIAALFVLYELKCDIKFVHYHTKNIRAAVRI